MINWLINVIIIIIRLYSVFFIWEFNEINDIWHNSITFVDKIANLLKSTLINNGNIATKQTGFNGQFVLNQKRTEWT